MFLSNFTLVNFRSHQKKRIDLQNPLTIIVGPNTSGKTNLLEAIFILATGKSFRATKDMEMISYEEPVARVFGTITTDRDSDKLELVLTRGELYGKKIASKKYLVNNIPKRMLDFTGKLRVSLFWPQDLELVIDSPSIRRRYLDFVLTQIDREYLRNLRSFEKGLRFRNKLLERIRERDASLNELPYWNTLLISNGKYLTGKRNEFLDFLNQKSSSMDGNLFTIIYDKSIISEERLNQYQEEEIQAATTLVGPHRDNFKLKIKNVPTPRCSVAGRDPDFTSGQKSKIKINERDLSIYGSRGEQRLGVLWLKLGELAFIKEKSQGEDPVLLLDDIFSEFDHENRQMIFEHIGNQQTIITTTDIHLIEEKLKKKAQIIEL